MCFFRQMIDRNRKQPHQSYKAPIGFPLRTLEQLDTFLNNADQIQNLVNRFYYIIKVMLQIFCHCKIE